MRKTAADYGVDVTPRLEIVKTDEPEARAAGEIVGSRGRAGGETQRSGGCVMAVLLLAEVNDGELAMDATAKAVTAAKALGDVTVLCAGGSAAAARRSGQDRRRAKVLVAEDAAGPPSGGIHCRADRVAGRRLRPHRGPATTDAKNVMPRVAALLDVMIISDASGVVDADTFERPIYAGNAIQTVKSQDAKKVITFRTSTFDAAGDGGSAPVETIGAARSRPVEWIEDKVAASTVPN